MIKKITKIILCVLSVFGFATVAWYAVANISAEAFYGKAVSSSLMLKQTSVIPQNSAEKEPYTYINIPKAPDVPLAMRLYPSAIERPTTLPPAQTEGQDPEPPAEQPSAVQEYPIVKLDLSEAQAVGRLACKNESGYSPDINSLARAEYPLKISKHTSTDADNSPLVLIIHTHGTECYLPENANVYTADTPTRSTNTAENVVAVGRTLADELNKKGVPTLHCETMFDAESYSDSYSLSEKAVLEYLEKYPSIQYVFDIHRDSIIRENNEKVKPITEINGIQTAQAMFVVGTDAKGANHPNWLSNLTVASIFQYALVEKCNSLMRPLNIRSASFNAEHAPGSVLIEVGTCGNTLSEAKNCALLLGQTIADIILNDGIN